MNLWKKFATVAALSLPLVLGDCMQPTTRLCTPDGIGTESVASVFNGAAGNQGVCTVQGSQLEAGGKYSYDGGLLIIDGNVPADTRVTVDNGKIFISGDIEAGARVKAEVPEVYSSYTTTVMMPMFNGKTTTYYPQVQTHYTFEHFEYQSDHDPAVMIGGSVGEKARVTSNHDFYVSGNISDSAKFYNSQSSYDGTIYRNGGMQDYQIAPLIAPAMN